MALGSTQSLTKMSTRNISRGTGVRCVGLTTLPHSRVDYHETWDPQPPGTSEPFQGLLYLFQNQPTVDTHSKFRLSVVQARN